MDNPAVDQQIEISWAACPRWATFESADLVDAIEQLSGRWAILLIDVQGSGRGGRRLASSLAREARELLAAGVSAETTVRAVHEHLYELRQGKVGASIHICEIDPSAECVTIVGLGGLAVASNGESGWSVEALNGQAAGFDRLTGIESVRYPFAAGARLLLANDGVARCADDLTALLDLGGESGSCLDARTVLDMAVERDSGRPRSDMAVAAIARLEAESGPRVLDARIRVPIRRFGSDL